MSEEGLRLAAVWLERDAAAGRRTVLAGAEARFAPGEISLVEGPSGSGKTTLVALLALLLRPTSGTVLAEGEPVSRFRSAHRDTFRRRVGLSFQTPRLLPGLTALENVLLPAVPSTRVVAEARARGLDALDALGAAPLAGRDVAELSGGERQRVELARALAQTPQYLLLDEPSAHQDAAALERLLGALKAAAARGAVVVVASHDPRLLETEVAARRHLLRGGRLEEA